MRNKRRISWAAAMRDLQSDRARRRDGVREERLRAASGLLRGLDLTSWRGRSGRRYVVGVHALTDGELVEVSEAVILAAIREGEGSASVVDVMAVGPELSRESRRAWIARMRARGARELHVHRLAEGPCERAAIVADLAGDDAEDVSNSEPAEALTALQQAAPEPGR
jgi:hypothetical protein